MRRLHLLAPGLRGPLPRDPEPVSGARRLERWLTRADRFPFAGEGLEAVACALFGVEPPAAGGDLPFAALRRFGDGAAADSHYWLQLQPICLQPDQGRLLLFDATDFDLADDEAASLAGLLRDHFREAGWRIEVAAAGRWYLGLPDAPRIATSPLGAVAGRNMAPFLPAGDDALRWHALLNEIQMLFYDCAVNRRRERRGTRSVDGVWLSGGGRLPAVETVFTRVHADEALLAGLARRAGLPCRPLPETGTALADPRGETLALWAGLQRPVWQGDPYGWNIAAAALQGWLDGVIQGLRRRRLDELLLYSCDGSVWRIGRWTLRRFWRRPPGPTVGVDDR